MCAATLSLCVVSAENFSIHPLRSNLVLLRSHTELRSCRSPVWDYRVQVEAPSTPECQEGVLSQGGHQREEHRVVHRVQEEHNEGHIQ